MKILLVQTSFLGDTILSTPVIAAIKKLHPDSDLYLMTTLLASDLVRYDPLLKGIITYDKSGDDKGIKGLFKKVRELKKFKFDRVYSLHKSYRTAILLWLAGIPERIGFKQAALSCLYSATVKRTVNRHDVVRNLSLLSSEAKSSSQDKEVEDYFDLDLRLFVGDEANIQLKFSDIAGSSLPKAVLVPGSAWKTKMWNWKGYRETAEYLLGKGFQVIILGSKSEMDVCMKASSGTTAINLAGRTTLNETMAIIKLSKLVVCNDSMSLHMASAFKVPNVAVFCATSPAFGFGPWKNNALVVEKTGLSCKPCRRHGSNICPTGTEACMNDLPSSEVINAIEKLVLKGQNQVEEEFRVK